jgi:hypothetical protein
MKFSSWNEWTNKSKDTPFESSSKHNYGDGEEKLGKEFNFTPLGQNVSFDVPIDIFGKKGEVKKLDGGTFNVGKEGKEALKTIISNLDEALINLKLFAVKTKNDTMLKTIKSINNTQEICKSKCKENGVIHHLMKDAKKIKSELEAELSTVLIDGYDFISGREKKYDVITFFKIQCILKHDDECKKMCGEYCCRIELLQLLDQEYINDENKFTADLNNLTNLLEGFILIIVDNKKGFFIVADPHKKISFERITRASPRFRIELENPLSQ